MNENFKQRLKEIIKERKFNQKINMEKYRKFSSRVYFERESNSPIFKLMGDYFKFLKENEAQRAKDLLNPSAFITGSEITLNDIHLNIIGVSRVILQFKDDEADEALQLLLHYDVYKDSMNRIHYLLVMSSDTKTKLNPEYIYEYILNKSLINSDIKGKQLIMNENELAWDIKPLTERTFGDIYLPNKIGNELRLYKKVFTKQNHLMRYLMVGIPGTGKTESTLVLSNEMIKNGVTIIKTAIGEAFKETVKLAELLEPSVIILDDIDLSLGSRNKGMVSPLLRSFLDVLDGTEKISGNVGILATTNSLSLLDIAARRPGRFDKTILFDGLTKSNIGEIIKKSLKVNFGVTEYPESFINKSILTSYYEKKLTGSHIFNTTELIYRKAEIEFGDNISNVDIKWVTKNIKHEIDILDQVRNFNSEITDTYTTNSNTPGGMGFTVSDDECDDEEYVLYDDPDILIEKTKPGITPSPSRIYE